MVHKELGALYICRLLWQVKEETVQSDELQVLSSSFPHNLHFFGTFLNETPPLFPEVVILSSSLYPCIWIFDVHMQVITVLQQTVVRCMGRGRKLTIYIAPTTFKVPALVFNGIHYINFLRNIELLRACTYKMEFQVQMFKYINPNSEK